MSFDAEFLSDGDADIPKYTFCLSLTAFVQPSSHGDMLLNCFHLSQDTINLSEEIPGSLEMPTQLSACNLSIHLSFI